jgi:hypothetical protein
VRHLFMFGYPKCTNCSSSKDQHSCPSFYFDLFRLLLQATSPFPTPYLQAPILDSSTKFHFVYDYLTIFLDSQFPNLFT